MPLNPSEAAFFKQIQQQQQQSGQPEKPPGELSFAELRDSEQFFAKYTPAAAAVPSTDVMIPVRDGTAIKTRLFNSHLTDNSPALIVYPGCGYFLHLFDINAAACSRVAANLNAKVFIMDIRVAPEAPLPTAIFDAFDVTQHIAQHANEFGINSAQLFTAGMSSGAHCATSVAYLLSQQEKPAFTIQHQYLLNGFYDYVEPCTSFAREEQADPLCQRDVTPTVIPYYGIDADMLASPLLSPLRNPNMAALPPTTIMVAEYDGLRSDSEDYAAALEQQGAKVNKVLLPGQTHNTFLLRDVLTDGHDPAALIAEQMAMDVEKLQPVATVQVKP